MKDFTNYVPSRKELRLALELVDHINPLFKSIMTAEEKAEVIKNLFGWKVPIHRITNLPKFKKILFKVVIVSVTNHNGKYIVKHKKVRKHTRLN